MPLPFRALISCLALALGAGCGAADATSPDVNGPRGDDDGVSGGQTGEENFGCLPIESVPVALGAATALGFSASELLLELGSERTQTLTYADGHTTRLQLGLSYEGGLVQFVEREFRSGGSGRESGPGEFQEPSTTELAVDCSDVVEVAVTLRFVTDDGAFDETWPATLSADTASTARAYSLIDLSNLSGDFQVTEVDPSRFDSISAYLSLNFVGMTCTGSVEGQGETRGSGDPDSVASATGFPICTF